MHDGGRAWATKDQLTFVCALLIYIAAFDHELLLFMVERKETLRNWISAFPSWT